MSINIGAIDSTIVIFYMLAVLLFGIWIGRNKRSSSDYFLGNRSLPWGAVLLSIVARPGRVLDEVHWVALRVELHPLESARQETAMPLSSRDRLVLPPAS